MLSGIQIAKVQTVHNSRPRRIGRAGTGLGWRKSGKQLGEKTLVKAGSRVQEGEDNGNGLIVVADQLRRGRASPPRTLGDLQERTSILQDADLSTKDR
ncbi:hypothetical protein TgHK011_000846 [Trichoderma gracile]|nr:hypothetical protein TgHK011_000846 [Trichoderma gracile]